MTEPVFMADPTRLILAAAVGILLLLFLIIKFKLHPVISMMISAIVIGVGAGMPLSLIGETVEKGVGKTLQGIALLIGLGSMFGGILEISGGAQKIAQTLIQKFGQTKAGWALGLTGLVIGTTVFFEAGVVILIPLAFNVAKQTKKSTLCYAIPLLAGLASGYAFVPPSAGSVLVANALGVSLGTMIAVGIPVAVISTVIAGIVWGRVIGNKIFTSLPANIEEVKDKERGLPPGSFAASSRHDSARHRQRRRHPLDAAGFRAWQYHRAGIGAERNAADSGGLFDCVFGQGVGGKLHRGHDHGFRHYGRHACRGWLQRAL